MREQNTRFKLLITSLYDLTINLTLVRPPATVYFHIPFLYPSLYDKPPNQFSLKKIVPPPGKNLN